MLANHAPDLTQLDPLRVGAHLDRPPDCTCRHRIAVVVEANQAGLRYRRGYRVESIEPAGICDKAGPLRLEHFPNRPLAHLRMPMRPRIGDALVEQPEIQFVVALHPQPRREESLAHQTDLVLDLPLFPSRCWVQATGSIR